MNYLLTPEQRQRQLAALLKYRQDSVGRGQRGIDQKVRLFCLDQMIQSHEYVFLTYPVSHLHGFHLWLLTTEDCGCSRFTADFCLAQELTIARLKEGAACCRTVPAVVMAAVVDQCHSLARTYTPFPKLKQSLEKFLHYLCTEYKSRPSVGLHAMSDDDEMYNFKIWTETTVRLTAQQVHSLGLEEMDKTIRANSEPFLPRPARFTSETPSPQLEIRVVDLPHLPTVMYTFCPFNLQKSTVLINSHNHSPVSVPCLLAHEIYPGHHLEVGNNFQRWFDTDLWWLSNFSGYIEGWGQYCEQYVSPDTPPTDNYQLALLRDVRLVVDTGIHSKYCGRWTFQEAMEFMTHGVFRSKLLVTGFRGLDCSHEQIRSEVLSIVSKPAYALSYKIGKMFFVHQGQTAQDQGMSLVAVNDTFLSRRVPVTMLVDLFHRPRPEPDPLLDSREIYEILTGHDSETGRKETTRTTTYCLH